MPQPKLFTMGFDSNSMYVLGAYGEDMAAAAGRLSSREHGFLRGTVPFSGCLLAIDLEASSLFVAGMLPKQCPKCGKIITKEQNWKRDRCAWCAG